MLTTHSSYFQVEFEGFTSSNIFPRETDSLFRVRDDTEVKGQMAI